MWNKKIIVTKHAIKRFNQRHIKFSSFRNDPVEQILFDLRPLNVRKLEHLKGNNWKVTTNKGKVYIMIEDEKAWFVKTVFKTDIQYEFFKNKKIKKIN